MVEMYATRRTTIAATTLAVLFAGGQVGAAAPINYDEAVSGDVDLQPRFTLDVGDNVWTGTHESPSDTNDMWDVDLPAALQISAIRLQYDATNAVIYDPPTRFLIESFLGDGTVVSIDPVPAFVDSNLTPTVSPLPGGGVGFDNYQVRILGGTLASNIPWTVTLSVEQVPEPSAIGLVGIGLVSFAASRGRRRRRGA